MPDRIRHLLRARRGFSLIEVAVAILILSVGIIGALMLFVVQIQDQSRSAGQTQALQVAQAHVDTLRRLPAASVALRQSDWQALNDDNLALASWADRSQADPNQQLRLEAGRVAPVATDSVSGFTMYTAVTCDQPDPDDVDDCQDDVSGAAFDRTVRVVAVPRGRAPAATLSTRIGPNQSGFVAAGTAEPDPPASVNVQQFEDRLWISWPRSEGAVSYSVTRDGAPAGTATYPSHEIQDGSLVTTAAGGVIRICVSAVGTQGSVSTPTCEEALTKPGSATAVADGGGIALSWEADPVSDPLVLGYRVERLSPGGSWTLVSATTPQIQGSLSDPTGSCADRYRIRAYRDGSFDAGAPLPGLDEGVQVASAQVVPSC